METNFEIRPARLKDAEQIFALIHLNRDQLVPRSMGNIVENIDRFTVAAIGGDVVGCATYQIHPETGGDPGFPRLQHPPQAPAEKAGKHWQIKGFYDS